MGGEEMKSIKEKVDLVSEQISDHTDKDQEVQTAILLHLKELQIHLSHTDTKISELSSKVDSVSECVNGMRVALAVANEKVSKVDAQEIEIRRLTAIKNKMLGIGSVMVVAISAIVSWLSRHF